MINMIAVIGKNRELGCDNKLLWNLPEDMKRFKELTTGHTIVMGRKTFESIGKPLPNRTNIIITRDKNFTKKGCKIIYSPEDIISENNKLENIFIIGGGEIYKLFLPYAEKLYLTIVEDGPKADTFFPNYSEFSNIIFKESHKNNKPYFTFLELSK